jgi:hypothetical protein
VSECSEWNGRKFTQKKIRARPYRGRGMLSVHPSVCMWWWLCWINFEQIELLWWNVGSLPNSFQVIFWQYFGTPRNLGLGPGASGGSYFQTYLLPLFLPKEITIYLFINFLKLPPYTLEGFHFTTHCSSILDGRRRRYH